MAAWDAAPIVDDRRPPQPARPINRTSPIAQALAGAAPAEPAQPMPQAPQASARAGRTPATGQPAWASAPIVQQSAQALPAAAPPTREVGFMESAGRTAASAATPVVRGLGMGLAGVIEQMRGVAELADAIAPIFGIKPEAQQRLQSAQDTVFRATDERTQAMREMYDPKAGEEMNLPGQIVGGIASLPIEMAGGMGLQRGVERASDVVQRGGTLGEAGMSGGVTGAANLAANLLPVKLGGAAGRAVERGLGGGRAAAVGAGAATGAGLGIGGDVAATSASNAALPAGTQFEDLQQEASPAVSGGLGAALGALGGAMGAPQIRAPRRATTPAPTPGTQGSVGAAGTDMAAQRRERAANLPVPIELTKGQAERSFEGQRFERETAKDPDAGALLRDKAAEQNERVLKNFEALVEETGAEQVDKGAAGRAIVDPILAKAETAKSEIRQAYDDARAAGEMDEAIDAAPLVKYLEKNRASATNAGVLGTAEAELVRLGGASKGPDGRLQAGQITLNDLEELRKTIGKSGGKDATNATFAGELKRVIDQSSEGAGGELYKAARSKFRDYVKEFKEQGAIRDLIHLKKNSSDRVTAFEDVLRRSVMTGTLDDLKNVRRTLTTAGDKGVQAWRELQGQTMQWVRDEATKNVARDIRGNQIVSPAGLGKAIRTLDQDGKLEFIFGKKGAETLRDIDDVAKDLFTAPPGAVNTSNTASVIAKWMADSAASFAVTGVPAPILNLTRAAFQLRRDRKLKRQVREALGPDDKPLLLRKADPNRKPLFAVEPDEQPPAPAPAPATKQQPPDPRMAEIDRLREGASPETLKVLDERAKAIQGAQRIAEMKATRNAEAQRLQEAADKTVDPLLRQALQARANQLRSEKIPKGEASELRTEPATGHAPLLRKLPIAQATELAPTPATGRAPDLKPLPIGRTTELPPATGRAPDLPRLPVGKAIEGEPPADAAGVSRETPPPDKPLPSGEAVEIDEGQWRAAHAFGTLDADRAKAVEAALDVDAAAVEAATIQHSKSPRAFDRAIESILERKEPSNESIASQTARSSEGSESPQGGRQDSTRGGRQGEVVGQGGADEGAVPQEEVTPVKRAERDFYRATEPTGNPITDRLSEKLRRDYDGARAEYDALPESDGGLVLNTDIARELSPDYRKDRTRSADVHEPASAFIKRVYADKLAAPTPEGRERVVMFTAGGTGAGKTVSMRIAKEKIGAPELVFDTNMNTMAAAVDKIEQALQAGRDVRILYTYTDPVEAFRRAVGRATRMERDKGSGRTVPIDEHAKTHIGASRVMRELADRYRNDMRVEIIAADNSNGPGKLKAADLADLPVVGENGLREQLVQVLDQAHRSGDASDAVRAGFLATPSTRLREQGLDEGVLRDGEQGAARQGSEGSGEPPHRLILAKPARSEPAREISSPLPQGPTGSSTSVVTERGLRVPVRYRLLEAERLLTSHGDDLKPNAGFPPELQPRDRSRDASEAQIARIANAIQPELLADSQKASDGAPIIGPDGVVESGNARTIALRRAYRSDKADAYRAWVADNAERFGLSAEQVRGMKQPVLVRERTGEVDRADFARQANESPVSAMSETEQAVSDAKVMPDLELLRTNDDGTINIGQSTDFIRQYLREAVGPNERNQLMTADGRLSQRGAARIRNAVFAKAYGDADLVAMMAEATDGNVRNVMAGLLRAAPAVAKVRELSEAGARGDAEFVPNLVEAVRRFADLREAGQRVNEYLSQGSLIGGQASPRVAELLRQLEIDSRAPRRIAEMVQRMAERIDAAGDPRQAGMFEVE